MKISNEPIYCFATPTRGCAKNHDKGFYEWVFNGERLYQLLNDDYPLFSGKRQKERACIETFPHAIVCAMAGRVMPAKPKAIVRRNALQNRGYNIANLSNIDFVDAALCAVAAAKFSNSNYNSFGNCDEGFIIVPELSLPEITLSADFHP